MTNDFKDLKGNVEWISARDYQERDKDGRFISLFRRGIPSCDHYYFDEHNKLIKSVYQKGGGSWVESSLTSIYDEDGKKIESYNGENDTFYSKTKYEYNKYNQLVGFKHFDKSGNLLTPQP